jgi:hypothetical protein
MLRRFATAGNLAATPGTDAAPQRVAEDPRSCARSDRSLSLPKGRDL